jgi:DNA-binding beta-propeller fold protein YncE
MRQRIGQCIVLAALALSPFAFLSAHPAADVQRQRVERRLYVADDAGGVRVYDIDRGHQLVRTIAVPNSGVYKGIAASVSLGRLYLTSNSPDSLICLDLANDRELWRKTLGSYADSPDITPDGRTLYVPYRNEDNWKAVDAETGQVRAVIAVGRGKQYDVDPIADIGPHNTWMNRAGTRVYLEVLTEPYVYVADVATNTLLGKFGPFSKGIRPFAVSDDEQRVYVNVDGLLGFEIGALGGASRWSGPMVQRIQAQVPASRLAEIPTPPARKPHSTPSHGINITPDQKEIWIVDGVYGYVYVFDLAPPAPKQIAAIPLFATAAERPHPGWVSFGIDGRFAYPDGGAVIDTKTKTVIARIPTTEKLIEIDFDGTRAIAAGRR